MAKIKRALVSVSDKQGLAEFAKGLSGLGVEILSTGGTAKALADAGVPVIEVSDYTGFPEMMDGRVKTLHPKIHGGLLALRDNKKHLEEAEKNGIKLIDMVVVNLYPFEQTVSKDGVQLEEAIEKIDIGGPSMLRSGAKNYKSVAVVCRPQRYGEVLKEMQANNGDLSEATLSSLALDVFNHTAHYDSAIFNFLSPRLNGEKFPHYLTVSPERVAVLRYGENPHQQAAFYRDNSFKEPAASNCKVLSGKEMSYNNYLDAESGIELIKEFSEPAIAIIKHNNPCGTATGLDSVKAYEAALACDPVSAFGGIVVSNRPLPEKLAELISQRFYELVIAPSYEGKSVEILTQKKNLRVIELAGIDKATRVPEIHVKSIAGGLLAQDRNVSLFGPDGFKTVTKRAPTPEEKDALEFAWKVCKHVKSNAIVYATRDRSIGVGAGQMSRVDSANIGIMKAENAGLSVKGTVMASDAYFPFRDGIDAAAKAGVTAIVQPGGSINDQKVIDAADEHGIAMVFTGMRHTRH